MVGHPLDQAKAEHTPALEAVAVPIEEFTLPASSVDLVVSSYALHHLRDPDKARLVAAAAGWLRPAGW
jgi:ubiquinone/menaquinone biosynthesis C-methylase UbiE